MGTGVSIPEDQTAGEIIPTHLEPMVTCTIEGVDAAAIVSCLTSLGEQVPPVSNTWENLKNKDIQNHWALPWDIRR